MSLVISQDVVHCDVLHPAQYVNSAYRKKKLKRQAFACHFASYCLHLTGHELRSVSQRTVCACQQGTKQKCLTTKKKNDLL